MTPSPPAMSPAAQTVDVDVARADAKFLTGTKNLANSKYSHRARNVARALLALLDRPDSEEVARLKAERNAEKDRAPFLCPADKPCPGADCRFPNCVPDALTYAMETVRLQTVKIESAEAENAALREQVAGLVATLTKADSAIWTAHGCALKLKAQMNGRMMYGAAEVDWWVDAIDETYALRREMRATTDRASKALSALPTTPEAPQDRSLPALEGVRAARMRPAKPDEMGD